MCHFESDACMCVFGRSLHFNFHLHENTWTCNLKFWVYATFFSKPYPVKHNGKTFGKAEMLRYSQAVLTRVIHNRNKINILYVCMSNYELGGTISSLCIVLSPEWECMLLWNGMINNTERIMYASIVYGSVILFIGNNNLCPQQVCVAWTACSWTVND